MAAIIKLEDGSDVYASSLGVAGALEQIAQSIANIDPQLTRWLMDVAQRGAPFLDVDLLALSPPSRTAFWEGVGRANATKVDWDQEVSFSPSVAVIRELHERRRTQGPPRRAVVPEIDLGEIWFDNPQEGPEPL